MIFTIHDSRLLFFFFYFFIFFFFGFFFLFDFSTASSSVVIPKQAHSVKMLWLVLTNDPCEA